MRKIFYRPTDLQIIGMSDGENSINMPYVETEADYHSTHNLLIVREEEDQKRYDALRQEYVNLVNQRGSVLLDQDTANRAFDAMVDKGLGDSKNADDEEQNDFQNHKSASNGSFEKALNKIDAKIESVLAEIKVLDWKVKILLKHA